MRPTPAVPTSILWKTLLPWRFLEPQTAHRWSTPAANSSNINRFGIGSYFGIGILVLAHILVLVFWYWLIFRWFWQIRMENSWGLGDSISVAPQIIQIIWPTVRSLAEGWDPARSSKKLEQCWLQAIDVNLPLPDLPGKNNPFCFRSVWTVQL